MTAAAGLGLVGGAGCTEAGLGADAGEGKSLDDFLPPLPMPDGTPQSVFAGKITTAAELIAGPAKSGLVGDYFLRNGRSAFVIQGPNRVIGVIPWGGNLVDAVALGQDGKALAPDHLGEVSMVYRLGRTCAHDRVEVLLDGSGGGPAVIRARGVARANDFINIKAIGILNVPRDQDPDLDDGVACATTYTLRPDSAAVEVKWTLFNGSDEDIDGPFGTLSDTGGDVEAFAPGVVGFNRLGIDSLLTNSDPAPTPYSVYQGPGVAYGLIPRHPQKTTPSATILVAGVSILIFGADNFLDIVERDTFYLQLPKNSGVTHTMDVLVGRDAADVDRFWREREGEILTAVAGQVSYTPSNENGAGVRVGVFEDPDNDGLLDADEHPVTYFDADQNGQFAGKLPPGHYLIRGDVKDVARSTAKVLDVGAAAVNDVTVAMPKPARVEFTVTDKVTGAPIPAKVTILGRHPAGPDQRIHEAYDRNFGVVRTIHALYGTSEPAVPTDMADAPILLPAGGPFRVFVSRGPEWSVASQVVTLAAGETKTMSFALSRVVDTSGYVAAEFHQHAIGSPDSPVPYETRLRSLVVEGIEFFASTDHDYLSDYDPLIDALGLRGIIDGVVGIESTPFAYGHFIAYPLAQNPDDPSNGAVDWAGGMQGFAMNPSEIWTALRQRGAQVIQINHPRASSGFTGFQAFFDVSGLTFDFAARTFYGAESAQPVPADWLRLPDATKIFSDSFESLETWNGFSPTDTDGDGVPEVRALDLVLRDYMNFLSFGKVVTPIGNSDTHTREKDPAGLPRTMVRVPDDSRAGLLTGLDDDVYATVKGDGVPRDVVMSNGPMLAITSAGQPAIGRTLAPGGGTVTLTITAQSAEWVDFDTIEVFANATFDQMRPEVSALTPLLCFTAKDAATLSPLDPCKSAQGGVQPLTVQLAAVAGPGSDRRRSATVTVVVKASDIPKRAGAQGDDAWLVVRVRGQRALVPVLLGFGEITEQNLDTLVSGSDAEIAAALDKRGAPATAVAGAILVDFDRGGWKAPFAP